MKFHINLYKYDLNYTSETLEHTFDRARLAVSSSFSALISVYKNVEPFLQQ